MTTTPTSDSALTPGKLDCIMLLLDSGTIAIRPQYLGGYEDGKLEASGTGYGRKVVIEEQDSHATDVNLLCQTGWVREQNDA